MAALTPEADSMAELTKSHLGKNSVGLTNFDNTSLPEVAQGSVLRIGSVLFYAPGDLSVGNLAGAADGKVYFYAQADGTLIVSSTAPTWSDVYQCWMNGTDRCYASVLKSGASYTQKTIWFNRYLGLTFDGIYFGLGADADRVIRFASDAAITWDESEGCWTFDKAITLTSTLHGFGANVDKTFSTGNQAIGGGGTWIPAQGLYLFSSNGYGDVPFEINIGGIWYTGYISNGLFICDGVNHRFRVTGVTPRTIYYHKFDS